jgi:glycosyltransferase involved in cell wall biosynthesis
MPAFHSLLPVRDERDIISQCLDHMLQWVDAVYVFDTGSVDNTWEIINEMALKDSRIKPLRRDAVYYSENLLRGWLFHQARQKMRDGDWFLRVDADEFHHIPPPEFVKTRLRKHETIVWHQYYNFCLLESEVAALATAEAIQSERAKPIAERRRWWTPSLYSEPRLCRYRDSMKWPAAVSFPYNSGYVAKTRLPIRHYPHRDPMQLDRRCRLRAIMMEDKSISGKYWTDVKGHHWSQSEWRKFVTPDAQKNLHFWEEGAGLPEVEYDSHLASWTKRVPQYLLHRFFVRCLDRTRATWQESNYPDRIPADVAHRLIAELDKSAL